MKLRGFCVVLMGTIAVPAMAAVTQLYGVADQSVEYMEGSGGPAIRLRDSQQAASRVGFRLSEDLANGWSANSVLEAGMQIDSGIENFGNGTLFGRQAYIGLSSVRWGEIRLGQQYTPTFYALTRLDPFQFNANVSPFGLVNKTDAQGSATVAYSSRFNNAIEYISPDLLKLV